MIKTSIMEKGFTLIEVLVSMLVLSIGLFGILAVIITSLQLNSSSVYRTIAAQQANAMAEMLRANPTAVGAASATIAVASFSATSGVDVTSVPNCLAAAGCPRGVAGTPGYVGDAIYMWKQQLASVLPGPGTGTITGGVTGSYVITVCWNESHLAAASYVSAGGAQCTATTL